MKVFKPNYLKELARRVETPDNGQVTIIGGSDLFHGAPILSLRVASRIVDMVYFSSPEPSVGRVAEQIKAQLGSFVWIPWDEVDSYIEKSDSVLIGPGMKRWHKEEENGKYQKAKIDVYDEAGTQTKFITERLLRKFPSKQWVIDGGALQTMDTKWIPQNAVLTPNNKEYEMLFGGKLKTQMSKVKTTTKNLKVKEMARQHNCIIMLKGTVSVVASANECVEVHGGNNGLTKGGTGDVLAGLTVALAAKNEPFLAASAASWVVKKAADSLLERVGTVYNADDLAGEVPQVLGKYV